MFNDERPVPLGEDGGMRTTNLAKAGLIVALQRHTMRFRKRSRRGFTNLMAGDWQRQRERRRRLVGRRKIGRRRMKRRLSIPVGEEQELLVKSDLRQLVRWRLDRAMSDQGKQEVGLPVPILPPALRVLVERPVWAAPVVPA
ncbi:protein of unknown function [Candidatus Nitrospira inopinata]|uniref:Uncharacterized protein n=2 Tax=Candidatus Nitrospira inopinata TaxID=1715989 RepID=A0A0S4KN80_9BACT|nr:protein of unknown function [Candidatus Nitrospira inopinata]